MRVALFTDTFLPDVNGVAKTLGRWTKFLESKVERFLSIPFL
jgi:hypothetical protein